MLLIPCCGLLLVLRMPCCQLVSSSFATEPVQTADVVVFTLRLYADVLINAKDLD